MKKSVLFKFLLITLIFALLCSCTENTQGDIAHTSSNDNTLTPSVSLSLMSAFSEKKFQAQGNVIASDFFINDISIDKNSDEKVLLATNYGIFFSEDGSAFKNSAVGIFSKNVDKIALDPNNSDYAVALSFGKNEMRETLGIYISENFLQGFEKTENAFIPLSDSEIQLVFDPSSYQNGKSSIIYLAGVISANDGITVEKNALYRSDNAGKTFSFVCEINPDSKICVHPTKGYLYMTDSTGFYRSIDHGSTFEMMTGASSSYVFVSSQNINRVVVAGINGMLVSEDSGETFESTLGVVPRMGTAVVFASENNENNMVSYHKNYDGTYVVEFSDDCGVTWKTSNIQTTDTDYHAGKDYPVDFSWSATDPLKVFMLYNNQVYKSVDGGENFFAFENQVEGVDITSVVAQNAHTPSYKAFIIGEDTVAFSVDNGESFELFEFKNLQSNEFLASVYPINRTNAVLTIGNHDDSTFAMAMLNSDSGVFTRSFADKLTSSQILGDAGDKNIIFAGNFYSVNSGKNWQEMSGCEAVFTQNPYSPGELFGVFEGKVVMSVDKGRSWVPLFNLNGFASDMAYDYFEKNLYVATGNSLYKYTSEKQLINCTDNIPVNSLGERIINRVEVDYTSSGRVYICGAGENYLNDCSVMLSLDSGEKWYVISSTKNDSDITVSSNGIQCLDITVDRASGKLTSYGGMYGLYEFDITKTQLK